MRTLVKLRLIQDLGYRLGVSTSTVSRIIFKWLRQMDIRLKDCINWPDRKALQKTKVVCTCLFSTIIWKESCNNIDCFQIFI